MLSIQAIIQRATEISQQKSLQVSGWVQSVRQNKFIEIRDGSSLKTLQLISPLELTNQLKAIKFGSYLQAQGHLVLTPHRAQNCELKLAKITLVQAPAADYPFQKKNLPLAVVRNYPHLRTKTNYFLALFRLRHGLSKAIHDFFDQEGFYCVPTPIITSNDTEGAGETFTLTTPDKEPFFAKSAQLTVSGQLHAEALAQGLGKVYTFGPCFRAEKSHTTRHLAEFWMVEAELVPTGLVNLLELVEKLIKFVLRSVLTNYQAELKYFEKQPEPEIMSKLTTLLTKKFRWVEYTQAIKILNESAKKFVFSDINWGMDLKSEHEKYLCQYFEGSIFVLNYPQEIKPFYMKNNRDIGSPRKTVANFDLIFPDIGEIAGGSLRESKAEILQKKAKQAGINPTELAWYFDLRRFGYAPSGGFGLGLERLIMFISGTENIKDTLAFPRFHKGLEY